MKNTIPQNIDKSAFRKGEYIGHCNGAQRIRKGGQGWETYALASTQGAFTPATASTLCELGEKLEQLNGTKPSSTMTSTPTEIAGKGPNGLTFTLKRYRLEWGRNGEVGPIGIPLRDNAPLLEIAQEIESTGHLSEETRKRWFNC